MRFLRRRKLTKYMEWKSLARTSEYVYATCSSAREQPLDRSTTPKTPQTNRQLQILDQEKTHWHSILWNPDCVDISGISHWMESCPLLKWPFSKNPLPYSLGTVLNRKKSVRQRSQMSFELPFAMKYIQRQPEDKWYHNVSLEAPPPAGFFGIQTTRKKTTETSQGLELRAFVDFCHLNHFCLGDEGNKSGSQSKPLVINKKNEKTHRFSDLWRLFSGSMSPWVHACEHHPTCEHGSFSFTCEHDVDDVVDDDVVGYDGMKCLIPSHVHLRKTSTFIFTAPKHPQHPPKTAWPLWALAYKSPEQWPRILRSRKRGPGPYFEERKQPRNGQSSYLFLTS